MKKKKFMGGGDFFFFIILYTTLLFLNSLEKIMATNVDIDIAPSTSNDDLEAALSSFRTKAAQDIGINASSDPSYATAWNNVNFSVKGKSILENVWGYVPSGKVAAIMGPSGAGKSSLLNVLAGRSAATGNVAITGDIFVAGRKINPVMFRENIAYVMQDDSLLATSTPREALQFSANLRLPSKTTQSQLKDVVDRLISDLGLDSCADIMIGGALIKGISGGQRKRTSVGVELITDPALLFLDEPTSGLDSYSAYNMIQLLKHVAESNATVLCTIHQPSSEVFQLFDLVIFMKDGLIFYQGPVAEIIPYFSKFGYECPNNYNPSDFVMLLSQTETQEVLAEKGMFQLSGERVGPLSGNGTVPGNPTEQLVKADNSFGVPMRSSWGKQLYWLFRREVLNIKRDTTALATRFGITIFLSLLFGLIFLGAGNRDDAFDNNFNSHFGAVTFLLISAMFGPAEAAMLAFPFERPMFMREYATGTYRAATYFLTKTMLELPVTLVQTLVQFIMCYNMIGLKGNFMYIVLAAWGLGCASCSVAVMIGCVVTDVKDVTELAPLLFVPQLLFAGFFIRTSLIPVFLRWAQYLCAIKYAINLVLLTEFDATNKSCQGDAGINCKNVLLNNDVRVEDTYIYILVIFALFIVFRITGAAILIKKARRFY